MKGHFKINVIVFRLRILQAKHFRKVLPKCQQNEDSSTVPTDAAPVTNKKDAGEEVEESGNDSDEAPSHADGAHDSDAEVGNNEIPENCGLWEN